MSNLTSALLERLLTESDSAPESVPDWREAYRNAAAVLASFEPRDLQPFDHAPEPSAWLALLEDSERAGIPNRPARWRLRDDIRREALKRLAERGDLLRAVDANPDRDRTDPLQIVFERVLRREPFNLLDMTREDLAALAVVREWCEGILPVPDETELRAAIPIADVLAPLQKLATVFVGRGAELARLEDFVGAREARSLFSRGRRAASALAATLSERVPLFVHGPGGIGKSTLIAKFVLDHVRASTELRMPFAYLDIDRATLDPQRPMTLVLEAAIQLATQFPNASGALQETIAQLRSEHKRFDPAQADKAVFTTDIYVEQLAAWANDLQSSTPMPLLLVVDTFEEVQFLGGDAVQAIWHLLMGLQRRIPSLRIVVAGRVLPREVKSTALAMTELDASGARALLQLWLARDGKPTPANKDLDEIAAIAGGSPMALRLAAQVVNQQGIDQLRGVETRSFLLLRVRSEKVQAQLYGRVLAHIHDPLVRKLAYPGLVVRRITPDVIREVLAAPCDVKLDTPGAAQELFQALSREVALVEDDGPNAVRHRPDVRRIMLADLLAKVPPATVKQIDEAAVKYYAGETGVRARAEEIYHRLRLGEPGAALDKLWTEDLREQLRSALEEVPPGGRVWLSRKLGVTPPPGLLAKAELRDWEQIVAADAQRYLQSGGAAQVLKLFASRTERSADSPLYRIEAEAHRLLGDDQAARECAVRGIAAAAAAGHNELALDLNLLIAAIDEGAGNLEAALARLEAARALTDLPTSTTSLLRLAAARIRIRRLLGEAYDGERAELAAGTNALLTPPVLVELRGSPALLRELVAELGESNLGLLRHGLEVVGLELVADQISFFLLSLLGAWGGKQMPEDETSLAEALKAFDGTPGVTRAVLRALGDEKASALVARAATAVYRAAVAASVQRSVTTKKTAEKNERPGGDASSNTRTKVFPRVPIGSVLELLVEPLEAIVVQASVESSGGPTALFTHDRFASGPVQIRLRETCRVRVLMSSVTRGQVDVRASIVAPDGALRGSGVESWSFGPGDLGSVRYMIIVGEPR